METNIILAGVGGQGIVSISFVIDMAAIKQGLQFKQAEVHGMSQRGGEVQSHLRVSDNTIHSELVPKGRASLILAIEPLEALRYVDYLQPGAPIISGTDPFVNMPNYPDAERLLESIASRAGHVLIPADRIARQAGSGKAQNMVLLGAASPYLGLKLELLEEGIREAFAAKGEKIQKTNVDAFQFGRAAGEAYLSCLKAGIPSSAARVLVGRLLGGKLDDDAATTWAEIFRGKHAAALTTLFGGSTQGRFAGTAGVPNALMAAGDVSADKLPELLLH